MKALIVDDHAVVRMGLKQILLDSEEGFISDEASSAHEALEKLKNAEWDIVLLDISLPDKNGIELLKLIRATDKKLPVLILSMYPEDQYAVRAIKAGANGYLTKESAPDKLLKAIQKVSGGGKYISEELGEQLALSLDSTGDTPLHETLSDREFGLLRGIASGKTVSEIAKEYHLSVKTVSTYRTRLLKKMDMRHNAELTHYAVKQGLVD